MLIKIIEADPAFENLVEELKSFYNVGTAAAAVKLAVRNHINTHNKWKQQTKRADRLDDLYSELQRLIRERAQIEASIRSLTGQ